MTETDLAPPNVGAPQGHYGVDVSSNNAHPIDWPAVATYLRGLGGGQPFAIIKVNEGTGYVNPDFAADLAAARAAGFATAGYLMDQASASVSAEEALYRKIAGVLPQTDDDEEPQGDSPAQYAAHLAALVAQDPAAPQYDNQSEVAAGFPEGAGLWLAEYNGQPGSVSHPCLMHQYSSSASIPGTAGQFDLNIWLGSGGQFAAFFGTAPPAPGPNPNPVPTSTQEDDMICTDPESGDLMATDVNGALYADIPSLTNGNLIDHPNFDAGDAESGNQNPCIGITPWKDPSGKWGWTFVTKPTSGAGGFGPYDRYNFGRDGQPNT